MQTQADPSISTQNPSRPLNRPFLFFFFSGVVCILFYLLLYLPLAIFILFYFIFSTATKLYLGVLVFAVSFSCTELWLILGILSLGSVSPEARGQQQQWPFCLVSGPSWAYPCKLPQPTLHRIAANRPSTALHCGTASAPNPPPPPPPPLPPPLHLLYESMC